MAGHALDIDDDAIFTRGHPGAQLIPATLAVAEAMGASGKAVLEALVVGYEDCDPGRSLLARRSRDLPGMRIMGFGGQCCCGRAADGPGPREDQAGVGHRGVSCT